MQILFRFQAFQNDMHNDVTFEIRNSSLYIHVSYNKLQAVKRDDLVNH